MKKLLLCLLCICSVFALQAQGVTTSSISGSIKDNQGEGLIGANITAKHTPTGSVYGSITDISGVYRMPNMKVGGPYTVEVSYIGFETQTINDVYLRLGEPQKLYFTLQEGGVVLDELVVTARAGSVGQNSGTSTQIGTQTIEKLPTLNRNIEDFTRLTPQASTTGDGTSFGGINNRFNAIYIDGAVNNDVFGLAGSGTNGGQTGAPPFSIDIIDQFQIVLSPYDVTYGGFAGGGINAVTKSGTNNFEGTAYLFWQNENMVGKTNGEVADGLGIDREKVAQFDQRTYGVSLGGPIIKDKVFFFANAEIQNDVTPAPYNSSVYSGISSDRAQESDLENLREQLIDRYDYDPGGFGDTKDALEGLRLFGKLDFNLNEDHKLTIRHQYSRAESFDRNPGRQDLINFSNNGEFFPSTTNSSALELNSTFGSKMSNNLIIGYTNVNDDRDPLGDPFPYVIIFDEAGGEIEFGSEQFSTANTLKQQIFTLTDNFKIFSGKHTFTIGTHNEFYDIRNVFLPRNFGVYEFEGLDAFLDGDPAADYERTYSLLDNVSGDETAAAAEFNAMQLGLYGQDEIAFNNNFTLTAGLRIDVPILLEDPSEPARFNSEVLPRLLESYEEFDGNVEAGKSPDGQIMLSPRLGANYKLNNNNTIRGGVGIFTSRIPFVWPGAMYNTNGITSNRITGEEVEDIIFRPDVQNQYTSSNPTIPSGDLNLFTKDFKYPQVLRGNLAYDASFGGWNTTLEATYTKTLNNVRYTNINTSNEVESNFTGSGDDRPVYTGDELDDDDFSAVYLASNTDQGYAYTLTASANKSIAKNLNLTIAYNYNDSYALFEGTSSQNSSQWRGAINVNGRNDPSFGRSDFAIGHRAIAAIDYTLEWAEETSTTVSLFYNGQSGSAISYVIGGGRDGRNLNNERGSVSRWRSLVYVPENSSDINLIEYQDGDNTVTVAEQWAALDAFIEDDDHLSERRGDYAEKNGGRAPWLNIFDLAIRQNFGLKAGGTLQFSIDIFNVANLLNNEWGTNYAVPGDFNNYELLNFEEFDADGTTPLYTYRRQETGKDTYEFNDLSSRWRGRLGIRYIFK